MQMDGSCPKIDVHHHVYPHIMRQGMENHSIVTENEVLKLGEKLTTFLSA